MKYTELKLILQGIFVSTIITNKNGVTRNSRNFMKLMRGFLIWFLYFVLFQGPNTCLYVLPGSPVPWYVTMDTSRFSLNALQWTSVGRSLTRTLGTFRNTNLRMQ